VEISDKLRLQEVQTSQRPRAVWAYVTYVQS